MHKPFYLQMTEAEFNRLTREAKKHNLSKATVVRLALKQLFKTKNLDQLM